MRAEYLPFGKPNFSESEIQAVTRILRSGWVGMGPETIAFERDLAEYLGVPHVVTVNSCTSGLFLSLATRGIGPGDEVICPSLTWCSTANAALYLGAKPVFCDVDPDTLSTTPTTVKAKLSSRTRAVMVVHFGGYAVDMDEMRAALPERVAIIEDAAHAMGSRYPNGRLVGTSGNLVCFSFYANKNLSTGEGGAIALYDSALADRLRALRLHALSLDAWKRFTHPKTVMLSSPLAELGYKMNFTDLQAAIGRVQLARLPKFAQQRTAISERYLQRIREISPKLGVQRGIESSAHAKHLFIVRLPLERIRMDRDQILLALRARNIGATLHYAPLHTMPLYSPDGISSELPATDDMARRILTLPISASMTVEDADYVADELERILNETAIPNVTP